jgi:ABC-type Mn2+/Zn2+ transport system ATPase subunit
MRISEVRINDCGPFISAHITKPKLLRIFGANGLGKITILDAIEQTIMSSDFARVNKQAESYFPMAGTEIFFDLDKSSIGEDAELIEKITELVITGHTSNFGQFRHMLTDKSFDCCCSEDRGRLEP